MYWLIHLRIRTYRVSKFSSGALLIVAIHTTNSPDTLSVSLSHDDTAHEQLDRPDSLERYLALRTTAQPLSQLPTREVGQQCGTHLSGSLVKTQLVPQFLFADGTRCVDFVTQHKEGDLVEGFDGNCKSGWGRKFSQNSAHLNFFRKH